MGLKEFLRKNLPNPIFDFILHFYIKIKSFNKTKYDAELEYWMSRLERDKGVFKNNHYRKLMLAMAERKDEEFLSNKIIADFGCGPRGSLSWANNASIRIGIDVLADKYADNFKSNIINHNMIYVKSTESVISLPSNYCDIVFSLNAIDHVTNFSVMCNEICRILKKGGEFIASFNIEEPKTICEPQRLTERTIKENFLDKLQLVSYRISEKGPSGNQYAPFFDGNLRYKQGDEGFLWMRAIKQTK